MAIAKNTNPAKMSPNHRNVIIEEETPAPRKSKPDLTKTASDRLDLAPASAKKRAIAVLESTTDERIVISPELRQRMVRDAAYFRAEQRGFTGGDPLQDWIEAEAEIDHMLGGAKPSERKKRQTSH